MNSKVGKLDGGSGPKEESGRNRTHANGKVEGSESKKATEEDPVNKSGDPGRTPGSAEGVEDFEKTGNE